MEAEGYFTLELLPRLALISNVPVLSKTASVIVVKRREMALFLFRFGIPPHTFSLSPDVSFFSVPLCILPKTLFHLPMVLVLFVVAGHMYENNVRFHAIELNVFSRPHETLQA